MPADALLEARRAWVDDDALDRRISDKVDKVLIIFLVGLLPALFAAVVIVFSFHEDLPVVQPPQPHRSRVDGSIVH